MRHTTHEPFGQPFKNSRRQAPAITRGISAKSRRSSRTTRAESLMKRPSFRFRTRPKQKKIAGRQPGVFQERPAPSSSGEGPGNASARTRSGPVPGRNHGSPWCPVSPRPRRCNPPRPTTERLLMASRLAFVFARQPAGSFSFGSSVSPRSISPTGSPSALARLYTVVYSVFHRPYSMFVFFLPFFFGRLQVSPYSIRSTGFLPGFLGNFFDFCGFARFLLGYTAFYWVNPVCK